MILNEKKRCKKPENRGTTRVKKRLRKQGVSNLEVSKMVEMSKESTSRIWALYKRGGQKAIALKTRGRKEGAKKTLTSEQEAQLMQRLIDTTPQQLKFITAPTYSLNFDAVISLIGKADLCRTSRS